MNTLRRNLFVALLGALLIVGPLLVMIGMDQFGSSRYRAPEYSLPDLAATPVPTPTAQPAPQSNMDIEGELKPGPVVVDLAHYNQVSPLQFQPLAAQLAPYGVSLRFWMNPVDLFDMENVTDLPDQSAELAELLDGATGLVVASPVFLWKPAEIKLVEDFVADGGRLLLISDPDLLEVPQYLMHDINVLSKPFGVIFNDDFLYDLERNDRNFTYFFLESFKDQAVPFLRNKTVAFYGAHSISGPVISQASTADSTQSSLRTGLTDFSVLAIGGQDSATASANVLAMGDFDVLTEPYVGRHDNQLLLQFVANFLATGHRTKTLTDFPAYMGADVALTIGKGLPVDADLLTRSSGLQKNLELTGRHMEFADVSQTALTGTLPISIGVTPMPTPQSNAGGSSIVPADVIYLGSYRSAQEETTLLSEAGIRVVEESESQKNDLDAWADQDGDVENEEDAEPADEPESSLDALAATPTLEFLGTGQPGADATEQLTATATLTAAISLEEEITPTVVTTTVLETDFGPRFLADETILILRQEQVDGSRVTAVLGEDTPAILDGLDRLSFRMFNDCIEYPDMAVCPFFSTPIGEDVGDLPPSIPDLPSEPIDEELPPVPDELPDVPDSGPIVLVIDDGAESSSGASPEAQIYVQTLADLLGFAVDLWPVAEFGIPVTEDLNPYDWVIWSSGENSGSALDPEDLASLLVYLDSGGSLTFSGRNMPMTVNEDQPSAIADVVVTDEIPELVGGISIDPIELAVEPGTVVPLEDAEDGESMVVMRRGPQSEDASAPVMVAMSYDFGTDIGEAHLVAIAMPLVWLPEDVVGQLVTNLAFWILID